MPRAVRRLRDSQRKRQGLEGFADDKKEIKPRGLRRVEGLGLGDGPAVGQWAKRERRAPGRWEGKEAEDEGEEE